MSTNPELDVHVQIERWKRHFDNHKIVLKNVTSFTTKCSHARPNRIIYLEGDHIRQLKSIEAAGKGTSIKLCGKEVSQMCDK